MRNNIFLTLFIVSTGLLFFACKKSKPSSTMSATINGHSFTAGTVNTSIYAGYKIVKGVKTSTGESVTLILSDTSAIYSSGIYSPTGATRDSSTNFSQTSTGLGNSETGEFSFSTVQGDSILNGTYSVNW